MSSNIGGVFTHQNVDLDAAFSAALICWHYGLPVTPETVRLVPANYGQSGGTLPPNFYAVDLIGEGDPRFIKGAMESSGQVGSAFWSLLSLLKDLDPELSESSEEDLPIYKMIIEIIEQIDKFPYDLYKVFGFAKEKNVVQFYTLHDQIYRATLPYLFLGMKNSAFAQKNKFPEFKDEKMWRDYAIVLTCHTLLRGMFAIKADPAQALDYKEVDRILALAVAKISKKKAKVEAKVSRGKVSIKIDDVTYQSSVKDGYSCTRKVCEAIGSKVLMHSLNEILDSLDCYYAKVPYLHSEIKHVDVVAFVNFFHLGSGGNMEETEEFTKNLLRGIHDNQSRIRKMLAIAQDPKKTLKLKDVMIVERQKGDPSVTDVLHKFGARAVIYIDGNAVGVVRRHDCKVNMLEAILPVLQEYGEEEKWFGHSSGFLAAYGTSKAPKDTPSKLKDPEALVMLARALNEAINK